jgi:hypothetical protein
MADDPTEPLPAAYASPQLRRPVARHWTKFGTLEIRYRLFNGGLVAALYCDGEYIAWDGSPLTSASCASDGTFDKLLGFKASEAAIPLRIEDWHDPLSSLDHLDAD